MNKIVVCDKLSWLVTSKLILKRLYAFLDGKEKISDLLLKLPTGYTERILTDSIATFKGGEDVEIKVNIIGTHSRQNYRYGRKGPLIIDAITADNTNIKLVFFKINQQYASQFEIGTIKTIGGKIELDTIQGYKIVHPRLIKEESTIQHFPIINKQHSIQIIPIYRSIEGISQTSYISIIKQCFELIKTDVTQEWISSEIIKRLQLPNFIKSLYALHFPKNITDINNNEKYKRRLAFDEML